MTMESPTIQTYTYEFEHSLLRKSFTWEKLQHEWKQQFSVDYSTLTLALLTKDPQLYIHSRRVQYYTRRLLSALSLSKSEARTIELAALFHDIGKISTHDKVLHKESPLTKQEFEHIKEHPTRGAFLLNQTRTLGRAASLVEHHHEHWDGYGYPYGLRGEAIPLGARIIAIADAFEAMTAPRAYHILRTRVQALAELRICAGRQFDPLLVDRFCTTLGSNTSVSIR